MSRLTFAVRTLLLTGAITCSARAEEIHPLVFWAALGRTQHALPLSPLLLGGSFAGRWLEQDATGPLVKARTRFRLFTLWGPVGAVTGGAPEPAGEACDGQTAVPFPAATRPNHPVLGLAAPWNAMPRRVGAEADWSGQTEAVAEILRGQGLIEPNVHITQALRVDLEGDGHPEVLVSATRYRNVGSPPRDPAPPDWQRGPLAGDYSIVVLRKLREGSLQSTLLAGEMYRNRTQDAVPRTFDVVGVLDANGDGIMEVAVRGANDRGGGTVLFDLSGAEPKVVLAASCGS
jgi:hypothetical protein